MDVNVSQLNILEALPQDMLVEILSRVGQDSSDHLFRCKRVCKDFLKQSQHPLVYKRISLDTLWPLLWADHPKLVSMILRCFILENPNALFRYGLRGYFDGNYIDVGLRLLNKASNMKLMEACYVYGLVMFTSNQIEDKDIGFQILDRTFPPLSVPDVVVVVRTKVLGLVGRLWRLNHHPFDDVAMCCPIKGHNGYSNSWVGNSMANTGMHVLFLVI
ncbi:F-box protein At2g35280-like [Rutidosis leptorrhynchoides]|uniref:F-box protein At2g35280-like n=1 Tax=Rutidosis leptorrhynchoides TaxID=125765 RepID=UPI003A99C106